MCLYPKLIENRKYKATIKNGGEIPQMVDERAKWVPVGCQKCMECTKQRARGWQVRLLEDIKKNKNGKFITLTISNEEYAKLSTETIAKSGYVMDNEIAKIAMRRFLERWRKEHGKSVRHWFVTELGHNGTENIHMHGIIWTNKPSSEIEKHWKYGMVWKGRLKLGVYENYVNEKTINYMTKYVNKMDAQHKEYKPKIFTSSGMGSNYTETWDAKQNFYKGYGKTRQYYRTRTGHKMSMPSYWRNKIYSEAEREQLWMELLDKRERWVNGIKIDVSTAKGEKEYESCVAYQRTINKRLGYGNDEINWDQKRYEASRRRMLQQKRIKDGFQKLAIKEEIKASAIKWGGIFKV